MVVFCFTEQCCAQSIIEFMDTQTELTEEERAQICGELLLDYLMWVGSGCCSFDPHDR